MPGRSRSWNLLALVALAAWSGCRSESEPTVPEEPTTPSLAKRFLVGEDLEDPGDDPQFWMLVTLLEVEGDSGGLFVPGRTQLLERVRFSVEEDRLLVRRVHAPLVEGPSRGFQASTAPGEIVAAFAVTAHDDVAGLGAERPWSQRPLVRADFSRNLQPQRYALDELDAVQILGAVDFAPDEPPAGDPPRLDPSGGYLEATVAVRATPRAVDAWALQGGASPPRPACQLLQDDERECLPVRLIVRHSFLKVSDGDFESIPSQKERARVANAFDTVFSDGVGIRRMVDRWAIWKSSHAWIYPEQREGAITCGGEASAQAGDDECAVSTTALGLHPGSRCDEARGQCTLPFRDRQPRPFAWYVAGDGERELFEPTAAAVHEWDVALRAAVLAARHAECEATGGEDCDAAWPALQGQQDENWDAVQLAGEVDACRAGAAYEGEDCLALADRLGSERGLSAGVIALAKADEMLVLCHSPVEAADPDLCAPPDRRLPAGLSAADCAWARGEGDAPTLERCEGAVEARLGDLRFNLVRVANPGEGQGWARASIAADPETGRIVSATVAISGERTAESASEIVAAALLGAGEGIGDEPAAEAESAARIARAAASGLLPLLTAEQVGRLLRESSGLDGIAARSHDERVREVADRARARLAGLLEATADLDWAEAQWSRLRSPRAAPKPLPGAPELPWQELELGKAARQLGRLQALARSASGVCQLEAPAFPVGAAWLGDALARKFGPADASGGEAARLERALQMRTWVERRLHQWAVSHQLGHGLGLRHNYAGSADAANYRPQYWQLRTGDGAVTEPCLDRQDSEAAAAACVGPRWFDPPTATERRNLLGMFAQSTVMDLPGDPTQQLLGLGAYDFAAVGLLYGEAVPVFAAPSHLADTAIGKALLARGDGGGGITGLRYEIPKPSSAAHELQHYSQLHRAFTLVRDCRPVEAGRFRPAGWNERVDGPWDALLDGRIVAGAQGATRCRQQPVDPVSWSDLRTSGYLGTRNVDAAGRPRLPLACAGDGEADLGFPSVLRWDSGADPFEMVDAQLTASLLEPVVLGGDSARALEREEANVVAASPGVAFSREIYRNVGAQAGIAFDTLWPVAAADTLASNVLANAFVFGHFARELARPAAGKWAPGADGVLQPAAPEATDALELPEALFIDADGVAQLGASPTGTSSAHRVARMLTESWRLPNPNGDWPEVGTSLADLYPFAFRRLVAQALAGDPRTFGARVPYAADGSLPVDEAGRLWAGLGWTHWSDGSTCTLGRSALEAAVAKPALECTPEPPPALIAPCGAGDGLEPALVVWSLAYRPGDGAGWWQDTLWFWDAEQDGALAFEDRVELHLPWGGTYVARSQGRELLFGAPVQKGAAARVLERSNALFARAYHVDPGPDLDGDGAPEWHLPVLVDGRPRVKFDPGDPPLTFGRPGCNDLDDSECLCVENRACIELARRAGIPRLVREASRALGLWAPAE